MSFIFFFFADVQYVLERHKSCPCEIQKQRLVVEPLNIPDTVDYGESQRSSQNYSDMYEYGCLGNNETDTIEVSCLYILIPHSLQYTAFNRCTFLSGLQYFYVYTFFAHCYIRFAVHLTMSCLRIIWLTVFGLLIKQLMNAVFILICPPFVRLATVIMVEPVWYFMGIRTIDNVKSVTPTVVSLGPFILHIGYIIRETLNKCLLARKYVQMAVHVSSKYIFEPPVSKLKKIHQKIS